MLASSIIGGLLSEGWSRLLISYDKSLEYYENRQRLGLQPQTPLLNLFDIHHQYSLLLAGNAIYILTTLLLFSHMKRKQQAYRLRWVLVIYDALNVLLTAYVCFSILKYKFRSGMLLCNSVANDQEGHKIAKIFALFYIQKYLEFFDTWWFIMRKSFSQVTFLHLFHHASITVVVGTILPFDYNGDMYLPILLNSGNHMLIYLHYLLATFGIRSWWASHITFLQLSQFILIFLQNIFSYRIGPSCGSPDFAKILLIVYMGNMIALFVNFFMQVSHELSPLTSLHVAKH
jgi:hypothetical protein